ncbi:AzlD domain-containing protein [Desulfosediminicola sp.]|uniref:AzlD domain-containing protein n=1 Tax=Desulfosediminicola sp. TaxID=2886825 RepID=UPI003AF2156A
MDQSIIFMTIVGMGLVTYLPRVLPMLLLSGRNLAPWIGRWLSFVPATVLAALLAPGLLCPEGTLNTSDENLFLLVALPTFLVAWKFKSFFGTVAVGMVLVALGRYFLT